MLQAVRNTFFPYRTMPSDLSDCIVARDPERPWLIEIAERLQTGAPPDAKPLCCYLNMIIFYEDPPRVCPHTNEYAVHDQIETRLMWDDVVSFEGEMFECQGGSVMWDGTRWIVMTKARLIEGDQKFP